MFEALGWDIHNKQCLDPNFKEVVFEESLHIIKIILFGFVARGDDTEESDIDVLIISPMADKIKPEIHKIALI